MWGWRVKLGACEDGGRGEIPVRSEIGVGQLQALADHAPKLWYPGSDDSTTVNHGTLLANKKTWKHVTIAT